MIKVGEHITLDIIGITQEYEPALFEKVINDIAKAAKVTILNISGGDGNYTLNAFGQTLALLGSNTISSSQFFPVGIPAGVYPFSVTDGSGCIKNDQEYEYSPRCPLILSELIGSKKPTSDRPINFFSVLSQSSVPQSPNLFSNLREYSLILEISLSYLRAHEF